MHVTIAFGRDYEINSQILHKAIIEKWSDCSVTVVGLDSGEYQQKYQVQLEKEIVYSKRAGEVAEDTDTIIDLIEERL